MDGRQTRGEHQGYELTWFDDSISTQGNTLQRLFTDTKASITKMGNFLEVRTSSTAARQCRTVFVHGSGDRSVAALLALREVDTTIFTDTSPKVRISITLESLGDATPDSVVIAGDFNRDKLSTRFANGAAARR